VARTENRLRRDIGLSGRGMASNIEFLTQSYKVIKAKKRTKLGQANAVVFDEDARRCVHIQHPFHYIVRCMILQSREFLTGFHKRKLAKKEESKKRAQAREKEERLEARREVGTLFLPLRFLPPTLESLKHVFDIATAYARRAGYPER
jgi:hypothetical protein